MKKRVYALVDYDGCGHLLNASPIRDTHKKHHIHNFESIIYTYVNPSSLGRLDALCAKYSQYWNMDRIEKLRNKLKTFYDSLYNEKGQLKDSNSVYTTREAIRRGYDTCFEIAEEIAVHVFMAELIASGLTPQDTLVLMNGSARQNRSIDKHNGDWNKNGYFSDNIIVWKERLKSYYPHYFSSDNDIEVSFVTSHDTSDNEADACAFKFGETRRHTHNGSHDQCKLGLILSQIHSAARRNGDQKATVCFFDDRTTPEYWAEHGTHGIEKSVELISKNPSILPRGFNFRGISFESQTLLYDAVVLNEMSKKKEEQDSIDPVNSKLGTICEEVGNNGLVEGCGPVFPNRRFADDLLRSPSYDHSERYFKETLLPFAKSIQEPKAACTIKSDESVSCGRGGASANTSSSERHWTDNPIMARSQFKPKQSSSHSALEQTTPTRKRSFLSRFCGCLFAKQQSVVNSENGSITEPLNSSSNF